MTENNIWELVIGLEIHAQIVSESKLFSESPVSFGDKPNTNISEFDLAIPGKLPIPNMKCVEQAIKTGLGLNAKINQVSYFDRKHYFYPDLPSGYQITQFAVPIVGEGKVEITVEGESKTIRIERIHLEQDAGKSLHDQVPYNTCVDFNRAGVALMEIVTKPDIRSAQEAVEFIKKLRSIMRYLGTCDGDMEKGSLRCDVNISIRKKNETQFGTRVEIKNINSTKNVMRAVKYEYQRQIEALEKGETIVQETRLFDSDSGETRPLRSKEDAADYRYFKDPDILPLHLSDAQIKEISQNLPELPDQKRKRYVETLGLTTYDAEVITTEPETSIYFEEMIKISDPKLASNWLIAELFGYLNKNSLDITSSPISAANLAEMIKLIENGTISGKIAKQIFEEMCISGKQAAKIVEEKGLVQITDRSQVEQAIELVLLQHSKEVEEYRNGKEKLFGFFVGNVMKETKGKANPSLVNEILKQKLDNK